MNVGRWNYKTLALFFSWKVLISKSANTFLTGSVSRIEKKKANHKKSRKRRPGTPALLLWSLETRRHEPKINMAEKLVDVIVKLRQRGKKGSTTETPVRQYTVKNVPVFVLVFLWAVTMLIFQIKRII